MKFDLDHLVDEAKKKDFVELALDVLGEVAVLVGGANASRAASVLTVLRVIFTNLEETFKGDMSPSAARHELQKLLTAIADNDSAIDEAIQQKFHPKAE